VENYFSNRDYNANLSLQTTTSAAAAGADLWAVKNISPDTWLDSRNGKSSA
jgi:hypothetical protein